MRGRSPLLQCNWNDVYVFATDCEFVPHSFLLPVTTVESRESKKSVVWLKLLSSCGINNECGKKEV